METATKAKEELVHGVDKVDEIMVNLPMVKDPMLDRYFRFYQGFWVPEDAFKWAVSFQKHFVARDDDVLIASYPKSGTTWLKSLVFTITNRNRFALTNSPLTVANPHDLVPAMGCGSTDIRDFFSPELENVRPRLYSTHIAYSSLPPSIKNSKCKIVYICRNPLDMFVSFWHFYPKLYGENVEPNNLEENFDVFFNGVHAWGPFWEHVLGYWKANLEGHSEDKILFLKYEDLKTNSVIVTKKLADFLGFPFSAEEEKQGVIGEIINFCSIENLRSLDINKKGKQSLGVSNCFFFGKGNVGDWVNYLSPEMVRRAKKLIEEKFGESSLTFDFDLPTCMDEV